MLSQAVVDRLAGAIGDRGEQFCSSRTSDNSVAVWKFSPCSQRLSFKLTHCITRVIILPICINHNRAQQLQKISKKRKCVIL